MVEYFDVITIEEVSTSSKIQLANIMSAVAEWVRETTNTRVQVTLIVKFSK